MLKPWYARFVCFEQSYTANQINHIFDTNLHILRDIVIFTDSLSILDKLEKGTDVNKDWTKHVWSLHDEIGRHTISRVVL